MMLPHAVLFDLDDTLAASFEAPESTMIERLIKLLAHAPIAVVTGRDFSRIKPGFLPLVAPSARAERFFVLAESSADTYVWDGTAWQEQPTANLTDEERTAIKDALAAALEKTRVLEGLPQFGERLLDKRNVVAFAMLGLGVPADMKYTWDPQHERRKALQRDLAPRLPEFDVFLGGATTIDVTRKGVNKAAGVRWLSDRLGLSPTQMLYIGDALYPGGNDAVVIETGIVTRETTGPAQTAAIIDELLAAYETAFTRA